jgi:1-acyl-sn-glycerol-3-phosphate acyltransferase
MSSPLPASEASLALDALIDSVAALRSELRQRFSHASGEGGAGASAPLEPGIRGTAAGWLTSLTGLDPARWLEQLRERLPFPTSNDVGTEVDEFGLDPLYLSRTRPLLDFLYERWWRIAVTDADLVPDTPRVLFVANCSGVLPWDALMLAHALEREHRSHRRPRFLVSDHVMTRPFLPPVLARLGAVRAHPENAERVLGRDEWLIAFPEGHKGALKPFRERYRLARFGRGGFVRLALRRRALLVPVAIVGAEEIHPLLGRLEIAERLLGTSLPYTATFPWLGPLGLVPLPSHWRIRFGPPLDLSDADAALADDPAFVARAREQVRDCIARLLAEELERRYSVWS